MRKFLHTPQALGWRKLILQIHLWVGIGIGLYIILIGVTGASLVFREEMEHLLHADLFQMRGVRNAKPDLVKLAGQIGRAYPDRKLASLSMPNEKVQTVAASLRKDGKVFVCYIDPETGKVIGERDAEGSFLRWLQRLHFNLLAGRTGRIVNGVGAIFLLTLCLTGMVIWWPGVKSWRRSLSVDFSRKWKRVNWDLHSAAGFWSLAVLLTWAVTGAYFAWPAEFQSAINRFSPVSRPKIPKSEIANKGRWPAPNLEKLIKEAQQRSPAGQLSSVSFPTGDEGHYQVRMARGAPEAFNQMDYHYFDQFTGKHVATWQRGLNRTAGDVILAWIGPLHFGTFGGLPVKILWLCLGLFPPLLFVTGFLMYWNRYLGKRWVRLRETQWNQGRPARDHAENLVSPRIDAS
ncbi:MAG: PepSY domain-containing protein [Bryobacteraceae bacterium]|nr:PepSY domain-containing protein [Bryobacteraceae bacterium]